MIKKRRPKIDAKRVPKRGQLPGGGGPPRRFPSKKGTCRKTTNKQKNNNDCRKLEVQCRKSEQSKEPDANTPRAPAARSGLSGAAAPRGRPQVHARVKRKKGTAERKKNQERKSKACGKRYKGI